MYATLADVKTHLGITGAEDDAYLTTLLGAAQATIDAHCGRSFDATTATREYGPDAVRGARMMLGADLLTVTTLTNGDGSVLLPAAYRLWPANLRPAAGIELRSGYAWAFAPDGRITVAGQWGFSPSAPADVVQATRELVSDLYHVEDRQATGLSKGADAYSLVRELPPRVLALLAPLRRRSI